MAGTAAERRRGGGPQSRDGRCKAHAGDALMLGSFVSWVVVERAEIASALLRAWRGEKERREEITEQAQALVEVR